MSGNEAMSGEEKHRCPLPKATDIGGLWMCDQCRTLWRSGRYTPFRITWRRM